ncbi:Sec-independent protein translocase protein TatB [Acinetobacter silvestris]|uniref:Sec-independent protein translocase protein TatB n=1 Tax=Acinetobacter silvestris TaxID=1977882 RepID=A0A1Y3CGF4_9GAMM|nr:Sec-independent protein translocase protein TatB [Acinetobacter silvestris]OTG64704.1 twin-arginine translocase subunit TatB [Acinetobacter silvestris]
MLDVGFSELLVFGIIALLVLGPDKLPEAARFAAKWYSKFKRVISNVQNDIDRELRLSEFREQMQNEMQRIQELEQKVQAQMQELQQQSIIAAEKKLPAAESSNKNLSLTYHFIKPTVPSFYFFKMWIKQQQCADVYIPPVETVYPAQLQVAV